MFNKTRTRQTRVHVMEQNNGSKLKAQTAKEIMDTESLSTATASEETTSPISWHEFGSESSLHGIKYATNPKMNVCRR